MCQGVAPERRRALYRETAKTLASLHSANVDSIGLGKYGRRNDYCKRQVSYFTWFEVKLPACLWSRLCLEKDLFFSKEMCCMRVEKGAIWLLNVHCIAVWIYRKAELRCIEQLLQYVWWNLWKWFLWRPWKGWTLHLVFKKFEPSIMLPRINTGLGTLISFPMSIFGLHFSVS